MSEGQLIALERRLLLTSSHRRNSQQPIRLLKRSSKTSMDDTARSIRNESSMTSHPLRLVSNDFAGDSNLRPFLPGEARSFCGA